jgi:iron complex transport system substrate-binding protein
MMPRAWRRTNIVLITALMNSLSAAGAGVLTMALGASPAVLPPVSAVSTHSVTDDSGRTVSVHTPPLRIVSLAPGATEMLFAAGAGEQVIATVEYSDEPAAARRIPRIGDVAAVDLERLVALHPDVVIAWPAGTNPAQRAKIARLNIAIYEQQVVRLAELADSVRRLGSLAGTEAIAAHAARDIDARLAMLKATYGNAHPPALQRDAARPSVLLQVWSRPIYTVGGRHLMSDALETCGARNLFADLPEASPVVDAEAVIARDPDIIVAAAPPGEGAAWLAGWRPFGSLKAVREQRLVVFEDQAFSRLGPSVIDATEGLCRTIAGLSRGSY